MRLFMFRAATHAHTSRRSSWLWQWPGTVWVSSTGGWLSLGNNFCRIEDWLIFIWRLFVVILCAWLCPTPLSNTQPSPRFHPESFFALTNKSVWTLFFVYHFVILIRFTITISVIELCQADTFHTALKECLCNTPKQTFQTKHWKAV